MFFCFSFKFLELRAERSTQCAAVLLSLWPAGGIEEGCPQGGLGQPLPTADNP